MRMIIFVGCKPAGCYLAWVLPVDRHQGLDLLQEWVSSHWDAF